MAQDFSHLHVHTEFSTLDSLCRVDKLVASAKEKGFTSLAVTDHGNVDGAVRFNNACRKAGIKPIIGSELYVVDDVADKSAHRYHVLALAKTERGFQGLCQGLTRANTEGFYRKPRMAWEWVLALKDVIIATACASGILSHPNYQQLVRQFRAKFGDDFYLETIPNKWEEQIKIAHRAVEMSKRHGAKVLVTNDVHYLLPEDATVHEVLLAVSQHAQWDDPKRWRYTIKDLHLRTTEEMWTGLLAMGAPKTFASVAIASSAEIAEKCAPDVVRVLPVTLPLPPQLRGADANKTLAELTAKGMRWRKLAGKTAYEARATHELEEIISLGFAAYFLVIWDMIWWCKRSNIMTGPGRGSVGGSLVAYCLGITEVDPLLYQLPFERFISPGRIDLPDVDMDFEDRSRGRIFEYMQATYGEECVAQVRTFGSMRGKMSLRDVARVFGTPQWEVGPVADRIVMRSGGDARASFTILDACEIFEECKRYKAKYPDQIKYAVALEGIIRQVGIHAAGIVLSSLPLPSGQQCVVIAGKEGYPVVNWDKFDLEDRGLMKLDVLGLNTLTVLHETQDQIQERHKVQVQWERLALDDPEVYKQFSAGHTVGVFQFQSYGLQRFCEELGIDSFRYIVDASALHRPGTLKSGLIFEYTDRKRGNQPVPLVHPLYDNITKDTYGIILYQEQIMYILNQLAGIPWKTADIVRKAISKKEGLAKMESFKQQFIDGCKAKGTIDEKAANAIYDKIVFFGSYSFNKAHSVEYGLLSYWTMWSKVHYPLEFMAACLNWGSEAKLDSYVQEARRLKIPIVLPDVNLSQLRWSISAKGELVGGLLTVKNVSETTGEVLLAGREKAGGQFASWGTLLSSIDRKRCNKRVLAMLRLSGALISLGLDPGMDTESWEVALKTGKVPEYDRESKATQMDRIAEALDFPPDEDPMRRYRSLLQRCREWWNVQRIKDVDYDSEAQVAVAGVIEEVKFGYRDTVADVTKGKTMGYADTLGGVYTNFLDGDDFTMMVFEPTRMAKDARFKEKVEGALAVPAIIWAIPRRKVKSWRSGKRKVMTARHLAPLSELLAGEDLWVPPFTSSMVMVPELKAYLPYCAAVRKCQECRLGKTRTKAVPMRLGKYRMIVLAEAPGKDENLSGYPLVGKAGQLLWAVCREEGLMELDVCATNILKCRPPDNKFTSAEDVAPTCSKLWLENEIKLIRPFAILALGGNAARWIDPFDKRNSDERAATVRWIDAFGCWVVYGPHPAYILHSEGQASPATVGERRKQLRAAVAKFAGFKQLALGRA